MPKSDISKIKRQLKSCVGEAELQRLGRDTGLEQRSAREISTPAFLLGILEGLGTQKVATIADLHRNHCSNNSRVNYHPYYNKLDKRAFPEAMKQLFEKISDRMLPRVLKASARSPLSQFDDIIIQDGTSFALHDQLKEVWPNIHTKTCPAGVKLNVTYSLLRQTPIKVQPRAAKEYETHFLPEPSELKNKLVLLDRAFFKAERFREWDEAGAFFAVRTRGSMNPIVEQVNYGSRKARKHKGCRLRELLNNCKDDELDLMVVYQATKKDEPYRCRLVLKNLSKSYARRPKRLKLKQKDHWLRVSTNLMPERIAMSHLLTCYRLRWQVELYFKELKSYANLHRFDTRKSTIALGLIWGALCVAALKRSFAHHCQLTLKLAAISTRKVAMCAHTFLPQLLQTLLRKPHRLEAEIQQAFDLLQVVARRSNPKRERISGILELELQHCGTFS